MKKLLSLLAIFLIVLSCSTDETSTPVTPTPAPIAKYTITLNAGDGGTVSTTGGEYEEGQTVSVTATAQGEYLFTGWSDGNTDATRTITVDATKTLTANFEKRKYALTLNFVGEGEVSEEIVNAGRTTEYDSGSTVKLTAEPAGEWVFVGWTGDVDSTENPIQVAIGEPKEITATFEKKKYPLTVNIEGEGEVIEEIVNAGRTTDYDSGTTIKLTAIASEGWEFQGFTGDMNSEEDTLVIDIQSSKNILATFIEKQIVQKGFDQTPKLYAKVAVIPMDFIDTPEEDKALFPTKEEIKTILNGEQIKNYFDTVSYGMFSYEFSVFDYVNLPINGVNNNVLYDTTILENPINVPGFNIEDFDYIMFVPVHDWGLSGGSMNSWELNINGEQFSYGKIESFFVPIFRGYPNRNRDGYSFQNSTEYKRQYIIPMENNSFQEDFITYPLSNFENTTIHEFIHALGIRTHSLSKTNGDRFDYEEPLTDDAQLLSLDYGDKFCVMGKGEYALSLTAAYRDYLGWHNETVRKKIDDYGTYEVDIFPINTKNNVGYIEIRIPNRFSEFDFLGYKNEGYFIELRSSDDPWDLFLNDPLLIENTKGVFVKKTDGYSSWLLDMSPSSHLDFYGQSLPDLRDVVLKPGMIYNNSEITIENQSLNQNGSFTISITIKPE